MTHIKNTVERAFQLAEQSTSIDEVRTKLKSEGYLQVDAHLAGRSIRDDLKKIIGQAAA